jgi:hypothetical protein
MADEFSSSLMLIAPEIGIFFTIDVDMIVHQFAALSPVLTSEKVPSLLLKMAQQLAKIYDGRNSLADLAN